MLDALKSCWLEVVALGFFLAAAVAFVKQLMEIRTLRYELAQGGQEAAEKSRLVRGATQVEAERSGTSLPLERLQARARTRRSAQIIVMSLIVMITSPLLVLMTRQERGHWVAAPGTDPVVRPLTAPRDASMADLTDADLLTKGQAAKKRQALVRTGRRQRDRVLPGTSRSPSERRNRKVCPQGFVPLRDGRDRAKSQERRPARTH